MAVRTTVVVVTWRGAALVGPCLDALARQTRPHRALVVDNASDDGTAAVLAAHPSRPGVLRLARNAGYAGALAAADPGVTTPFTAWLNDDAEPAPGWLAALEDALDADPGAAAASAALHDAAGVLRSTGTALTAIGYGRDTVSTVPFGVCGGAALLRTAAVRAVGGVPAEFFCYYEDVDVSWRLRLAGHRVVAVAGAVARHAGGATSAHGSRGFHRWNERNRLLVLLRCAPARVAAREVARFAVLTALLPWRADRPPTPQFRAGLRLRVLAGVARRAVPALAERRRSRAADRAAVWRAWAGAG